LETILAIAEARGIKVLVGLNFDEDYWDLLWDENVQLADFLNESYVKCMLAANQINKIAQHYTSFKGWYISEEFEERTWNYYNRLDMIISYLHDLSRDLKALTPAASVALSTYICSPPPAQVYHETMSQVLANTNISDLYFSGWHWNRIRFTRHSFLIASMSLRMLRSKMTAISTLLLNFFDDSYFSSVN